MQNSRRLPTLLAAAGALAVVVLGGVYWQDIAAWVEFYRLFESIGKNEHGYPEYRHRQTGIVMVRVPGGTFMMGTSEKEAERLVAEFGDRITNIRKFLDTEQPQHEVILSPFLIAKHELIQAQWKNVMGDNPAYVKGATRPVDKVSWHDCQEFCEKTRLLLPTEAQWEYACRAGTSGPFGGTGQLADMGWYKGNSGGAPHPVEQKKPNAFGLYDMHGNVFEWCRDWYQNDFYQESTGTRDPCCENSGSENRVIRGGAWHNRAENCRSARRIYSTPTNGAVDKGFRPAFYPLPRGL